VSVVATALSVVVLLAALALATNAFGLRAVIPRAAQPLWQVPAAASPTPRPPSGLSSLSLHGPPTNIRIPKIKVNTTIVPLAVDNAGALEPPPNFTQVGWYAQGAAPGDIGPAVLAGHYDNTISGTVFYRLRLLVSGDHVQIERDGKWIDFTVVYSGEYSKQQFPTGLVYGPTPDPELRLITCGGTFNGRVGSYDDNIVVYAVETK
jgi:sortase (surface protein transpeptidase)